MEAEPETIKAYLFPESHAAMGDWTIFFCHRDRQGLIKAHKLASSQSLAIDVFDTIKISNERDQILDRLARKRGVPDGGPRTTELEWCDPKNLLNEPRA